MRNFATGFWTDALAIFIEHIALGTRRPRDFHLSHARLRPPRLSPLRARPRARTIWAGARRTLTRRLRDPPVSKRRHKAIMHSMQLDKDK